MDSLAALKDHLEQHYQLRCILSSPDDVWSREQNIVARLDCCRVDEEGLNRGLMYFLVDASETFYLGTFHGPIFRIVRAADLQPIAEALLGWQQDGVRFSDRIERLSKLFAIEEIL